MPAGTHLGRPARGRGAAVRRRHHGLAPTAAGPRFLLLHRAHLENPGATDWAWGPPAGARLPREAIDACAARELLEETGIKGPPQLTAHGQTHWPLYMLRLDAPRAVRLSDEHDAFQWADAATVRALVWPENVQAPVVALAAELAGAR